MLEISPLVDTLNCTRLEQVRIDREIARMGLITGHENESVSDKYHQLLKRRDEICDEIEMLLPLVDL